MTKLLNALNLKTIILIGLVFRLIAVVFSKGYAFTDDQYEVVDLAQNMLDKMPDTFPPLAEGEGYIFNLIYPCTHYVIFALCEALNIYNPDVKMFGVRLLHALVSLASIYYGYKLTERLSNRPNDAKIVGLLLSIFWIFPFMSVRSLREFFCIPMLLMGSYYAADKNMTIKKVVIMTWWFTLAFIMRYQIIFIPFAVGLVWLFNKKTWHFAFIFGISFGIFFMLTQGLFDFLYWGNPFASIATYLNFNKESENIILYPNGPWHRYIGTIAGLTLGLPFIPLLAGYFRTATQQQNRMVLFLGTLFFMIFHCYYPNKQERFILPFMPYFLMLGVIGYRDIYEQFEAKKWLVNLNKVVIVWFLILNTITLCLLSVTYSKRSRVESMVYLREKGDMTNFVLENFAGNQPHAPFYLQKRYDCYTINSAESLAQLPADLQKGLKPKPNYVIFEGDEKLDERLIRLKKVFPTLQKEAIIAPSFVDNIAYLLNPSHNHNETWFIYKIY